MASLKQLEQAVIEGNAKKIQSLLRTNKKLINNQDNSLKWTPLHAACVHGHLEVVKILVTNGARLNLEAYNGKTALWYAKIKAEGEKKNTKYKAIEQYLLDHGAKPYVGKAHVAAKLGNIEELEALYKENYSLLSESDSFGQTPLFYAAFKNQKDAITCLLDHGVSPEYKNKRGKTVLDYAKPALKKIITHHINKVKKDTDILAKAFEKLLESELEIAQKSKKKILILLGETHNFYVLEELEKKILAICKKHHISQLYNELHSNLRKFRTPSSVQKFAKNKLHMHMDYIDNHPSRFPRRKKIKKSTGITYKSISDRNVVMAKIINQKNKNAIFITGATHLMGFLEESRSKINPRQYHILPINLSSMIKKVNSWTNSSKNVIQIANNKFTQPQMMMRRSFAKRNALFAISFLFITGLLTCAFLLNTAQFMILGGLYTLIMGTMTGSLFKEEIATHFGLSTLQAYCQHNTRLPANKEKLLAFQDGVKSVNENLVGAKSLFYERDWRYMRDYYAGQLAAQEKETPLIHKIKKKLAS